MKTGLLCFKIKYFKLFKSVCGTCKQFRQEKLGYSTWYANRMIHYLTYKNNNKQQQQRRIFFSLSKVTITQKVNLLNEYLIVLLST